MTPALHAGFAQRCAEVCPGFRATGAPRRARKSELLEGELAGECVIAKRLLRDDPVWTWYQAREIAIYREFERQPPRVRVPRFVAAGRGVLVIERLPGAPLATRRRPYAELPVRVIEILLATRARLASWPGAVPLEPPPPRVRAQLRERLLEDPTGPWIRDGVMRAARRGLVDGEAARRIGEALVDDVGFCHGDLLLRNAVADGDEVGLVDWECAGPHLRDWDLALLWSQLAPAARAPIEAAAGSRAFYAVAAFALIRELRFLRAFGDAGHPDHARLRDELAELVARLTVA
jgi:aminoglycoside phosphotransferase